MREVRGWIDRHAIRAEDWFGALRNEVAGRSSGNLAPRGEHFPWANEVKLFYLIEDEDAGVHWRSFTSSMKHHSDSCLE
jgi:hypothetical protein